MCSYYTTHLLLTVHDQAKLDQVGFFRVFFYPKFSTETQLGINVLRLEAKTQSRARWEVLNGFELGAGQWLSLVNLPVWTKGKKLLVSWFFGLIADWRAWVKEWKLVPRKIVSKTCHNPSESPVPAASSSSPDLFSVESSIGFSEKDASFSFLASSVWWVSMDLEARSSWGPWLRSIHVHFIYFLFLVSVEMRLGRILYVSPLRLGWCWSLHSHKITLSIWSFK